ncbi:MAG TPA: efflux RND transporter periplasmic adaptor subunit [Acetobacteraceae bacterium]|jgi:membrane fusion protein, multidrug efflux system|nr:efflux RND transporter periplasmic adaptor subunit [Acetobacteraceae bacterium]
MSKRTWGAGALLIVLAAVAVWRLGPDAGVSHAKAQAAPSSVPVTPGVVSVGNMPVFLQGIGTVQAYNTVTVKTRVDGPIVQVAFKEGQEVKKNDLLFQIDPRTYEAVLEQALAAKAKDQAQLVTAQADLARYASLVGRGFQTRQSYDDQRGLVAQLQAAVQGDQAQIDTARLNLDFTEIRSPIDGRTGARLVDIGNLLQTNANTPLVMITQIKPIFVTFTLPQNTLDEIRQYQAQAPLDVTAVASDGKTELAQGKLSLIDNNINQATGTILLKATFPNQDERLWPGEFVNARVTLRVRQQVATVPSETVQQGPDGDYVYVIAKDDTVTRRPVTVADVQSGLAVVTHGLKPGERVVVGGQYRLTEGARVTLRQPVSKKTAG